MADRVKQRFVRAELPPGALDFKSWPKVDDSAFSDKKKAAFERNKRAVEAVAEGVPQKVIEADLGIAYFAALKQLKRCLAAHDDGRIWGYRALVPNVRVKKYERRAPVKRTGRHTTNGGSSGAFTQLLDRFPDLPAHLEDAILPNVKRNGMHLTRPRLKNVLKALHDFCKAKEVKDTEYPFNTQNKGRMSLKRYIDSIIANSAKNIALWFGKVAGQRWGNGKGSRPYMPATRLWEDVQLDGHKLDAHCTIQLRTRNGSWVDVVLERIWVLVLVEVVSEAVLGWAVSYKRNYDASDVIRCIQRALIAQGPREYTIKGLKIRDGGGFPVDLHPELERAGFDRIKLDNALSHKAEQVIRMLNRKVGSAVHFGAVANPNARHLVENIFGRWLAPEIQRLPSTTGSRPGDPKNQGSVDAALTFCVRESELLQVVDVVLANGNAEPTRGVDYSTPNADIKTQLNDPDSNFLPRPIPEDAWGHGGLAPQIILKRVSGNKKKGARPFIYFRGAKYTSDLLECSYELVGRSLVIHANPDKGQTVMAFFQDGTEFGPLLAKGKWGLVPHTIEMREEINALSAKKLLPPDDDPVQAYMQYLGVKAAARGRASKPDGTATTSQDANKIAAAISRGSSMPDIDTAPPDGSGQPSPGNAHAAPSGRQSQPPSTPTAPPSRAFALKPGTLPGWVRRPIAKALNR